MEFLRLTHSSLKNSKEIIESFEGKELNSSQQYELDMMKSDLDSVIRFTKRDSYRNSSDDDSVREKVYDKAQNANKNLKNMQLMLEEEEERAEVEKQNKTREKRINTVSKTGNNNAKTESAGNSPDDAVAKGEKLTDKTKDDSDKANNSIDKSEKERDNSENPVEKGNKDVAQSEKDNKSAMNEAKITQSVNARNSMFEQRTAAAQNNMSVAKNNKAEIPSLQVSKENVAKTDVSFTTEVSGNVNGKILDEYTAKKSDVGQNKDEQNASNNLNSVQNEDVAANTAKLTELKTLEEEQTKKQEELVKINNDMAAEAKAAKEEAAQANANAAQYDAATESAVALELSGKSKQLAGLKGVEAAKQENEHAEKVLARAKKQTNLAGNLAIAAGALQLTSNGLNAVATSLYGTADALVAESLELAGVSNAAIGQGVTEQGIGSALMSNFFTFAKGMFVFGKGMTSEQTGILGNAVAWSQSAAAQATFATASTVATAAQAAGIAAIATGATSAVMMGIGMATQSQGHGLKKNAQKTENDAKALSAEGTSEIKQAYQISNQAKLNKLQAEKKGETSEQRAQSRVEAMREVTSEYNKTVAEKQSLQTKAEEISGISAQNTESKSLSAKSQNPLSTGNTILASKSNASGVAAKNAAARTSLQNAKNLQKTQKTQQQSQSTAQLQNKSAVKTANTGNAEVNQQVSGNVPNVVQNSKNIPDTVNNNSGQVTGSSIKSVSTEPETSGQPARIEVKTPDVGVKNSMPEVKQPENPVNNFKSVLQDVKSDGVNSKTGQNNSEIKNSEQTNNKETNSVKSDKNGKSKVSTASSKIPANKAKNSKTNLAKTVKSSANSKISGNMNEKTAKSNVSSVQNKSDEKSVSAQKDLLEFARKVAEETKENDIVNGDKIDENKLKKAVSKIDDNKLKEMDSNFEIVKKYNLK